MFIQASFWREGVEFYSPKTYNFPLPTPNGSQIVCPESFFGQDNELQIYSGNFILMDSKHRKLFVIKRSEECKCMPKFTRIRLAAELRPGPLGELMPQ